MKFVLFACAVLCFSLVAATRTEGDYLKAWLDFTAKYSKTYRHDEVHYRYAIFKKNVDFVDAHNAKKLSYTVGINKFADMTTKEFSKYFKGLAQIDVETHPRRGLNQDNENFQAVPTSWDWRTKGAVTPIKNQGQCGSCWAFSAVGSLEGCHFNTTNSLVGLSEENLVDCSTAQGNEGCNGGLMDNAFQYVIANNGLDTETSYPYTAGEGESGTCQYSASNCGTTLKTGGYTDVTSGSETALQQAVYLTPTSVAIDASQNSFQLYTSGVYYEPACSSTSLDHGVLAVGWGVTSGSYPNYWIVKNSWGTDWGISGYILMARNQNNNCGIATQASYPNPGMCGKC